jgi:hypothetical protein
MLERTSCYRKELRARIGSSTSPMSILLVTLHNKITWRSLHLLVWPIKAEHVCLLLMCPKIFGTYCTTRHFSMLLILMDWESTLLGSLRGTTRYKHFCGQNPKFAQHLRTWGEAGTVKICTTEEYAAVGAGIGGGFENTDELRVMKYDAALHGPDKIKWEKAVIEEHNRMLKFNVWKAVRRMDMSAATKVITSTWAMKKKASGMFRARINAQGFEQREGLHYDGSSISAPVSNEMVMSGDASIICSRTVWATPLGHNVFINTVSTSVEVP